MTTQRQEAERLFVNARDMPEGLAKHEALEHAARAADAADHFPLAVTCRINLIGSSYDLNRYDLMLPPFAWCTQAERQDPTAFDEYELHRFDWAHKWIASGLLRDPRFTLAQLESVVDQLAQRYQLKGYSMQPVHGARADLAHHVGDLTAYEQHFTRFLAMDRGPMSDCEWCVLDEQVDHLIRQDRYEEAVRLGEPVLAGEPSCSTQPHGILTSLLPAYSALGQVPQARDAHLVAYRLIRADGGTSGSVSSHLAFCATSGNVERGLVILRDHLDRVHNATSPNAAMHFAASASLLLSRVPAEQRLTFDVPGQDRLSTIPMSGSDLRAQLHASALELAGRFDARNGTTVQSERIREALERADDVHVPLTVLQPVPVEPESDEPIIGDPVELATRMSVAYEAGDFVLGQRLLDSLPPDLDALLPADLAAIVEARRLLNPDTATPDDATRLTDAMEQAGAVDLAIRYRLRFVRYGYADDDLGPLTDQIAELLATADRDASPYTKVLARLILAELRDLAHEHDEAGVLIEQAKELAAAGEPALLPRVAVDAAEHLARRQDLDGALAGLTETLALPGLPENVRYDGLMILSRVHAARREADASIAAATRLVEEFRSGSGDWVAGLVFHRVMLIEEFGKEAEHLAVLRSAVADGKGKLGPLAVAKVCYVLSGAYLHGNRPVESAETLEEALRLIQQAGEEGMTPLGLQVRFRLGQVCARLGEYQQARTHLTAALELVPPDAPHPRAVALDAMGAVLRALRDPEASAASYAGAATAWEETGDPAEAAGSWIESAGMLPVDRHDDTLATLVKASMMVDEITDDSTRAWHTGRIAATRAFVLDRTGQFEAAMAENSAAEEIALSLGDTGWSTFLAVRGARFLLNSGQAGPAEEEARKVADLLGPETAPELVGDLLGVLSDALTELGRTPSTDPLVRDLTSRLDA